MPECSVNTQEDCANWSPWVCSCICVRSCPQLKGTQAEFSRCLTKKMLNIGLCWLLLVRARIVSDHLVPSRERGRVSERDNEERELGLWVQMG